jgi:cell division septation protein DedD
MAPQGGTVKSASGARPAFENGPPRIVSGATTPEQNVPAASPTGAFLVQIAAVTHEEDAAALAGALRKKSYAAAVVNNPTGRDKLFHVVLGPYASLQDAEAMKLKLQGEGYNPIVKR